VFCLWFPIAVSKFQVLYWHLWSILNWFVYKVKFQFSAGLQPVFPETFLIEAVFLSMYTSAKNQMTIATCDYYSFFCSVGPQVSFFSQLSFFVILFFIMALYYNLKSSVLIHLAFLFLLRIALTIHSLLCFHMNFGMYFSISVKSDIGILMEIALNL
jgi:hypothetical protein